MYTNLHPYIVYKPMLLYPCLCLTVVQSFRFVVVVVLSSVRSHPSIPPRCVLLVWIKSISILSPLVISEFVENIPIRLARSSYL